MLSVKACHLLPARYARYMHVYCPYCSFPYKLNSENIPTFDNSLLDFRYRSSLTNNAKSEYEDTKENNNRYFTSVHFRLHGINWSRASGRQNNKRSRNNYILYVFRTDGRAAMACTNATTPNIVVPTIFGVVASVCTQIWLVSNFA